MNSPRTAANAAATAISAKTLASIWEHDLTLKMDLNNSGRVHCEVFPSRCAALAESLRSCGTSSSFSRHKECEPCRYRLAPSLTVRSGVVTPFRFWPHLFLIEPLQNHDPLLNADWITHSAGFELEDGLLDFRQHVAGTEIPQIASQVCVRGF